MDKLKMQTPDLTDKNIERIASLFPNVITETKDENGNIKKAIDFDLLKTTLSKNLVEADDERYRLDWPGKKVALLKANTPITKTLRPCRKESVNFDTTENIEINWNDRYVTGDLPWDTGKRDFNLSEIVTKRNIRPCRALEVGCGTGSNAIWLSRRGFSVTAVDIAEVAIQNAIKKTSNAGVRCKFYVRDFMTEKISGAPFGFIFDRGCFHSFDLAADRSRYAEMAHSYLKKDGLWLTLVGNADAPRRDPGPPQRTARDIVKAVEPYFQILLLYVSHFDSNMKKAPKAWVCFMQKR